MLLVFVTHSSSSVVIEIHVRTNASTNSIELIADQLLVRINSPPVKGKVNKNIIQLLSKTFVIAKNDVIIVRGLKSSIKQVRLVNTTKEKVKTIIRQFQTTR